MKTIIRLLFCLIAPLTLVMSGCQTAAPGPATALTSTLRKQITEKGRDPRTYWITVYPREDGTWYFAGANRLHPNQQIQYEIANVKETELPLIALGKKAFWMVDTSSADSWLNYDLADFFNTKPLGNPVFETRPRHVADDFTGYLCVIPQLTLDSLYIESALAYLRGARGSFWPLSRDRSAHYVHFIMGANILQQFSVIHVNMTDGIITLSSTGSYEPVEEQLIAAAPVEWGVHGLTVKGSVNGHPETFIIDTAGAYSCALSEPDTAVIRHINVGEMVFRNTPVVDARDLGMSTIDMPRLGLHLLDGINLVINNDNKKIYFERHLNEKELQKVMYGE